MAHFDDVLRQIGEFGRYQKVLFVLMGLVAVPAGMHTLSMVFLGGEMRYACWDRALYMSVTQTSAQHDDSNTEYKLTKSHSQQNSSYIQNASSDQISAAMFGELIFKHNSSLQTLTQYTCLRPVNVREWHNGSDALWVGNASDMQDCEAWTYDRWSVFSNTIVSQWDLVCDREWMVAMATTIYMIGFLFGTVLFGSLADRFGRRKVLVITVVTASVVATAAAFAPDYISFVVMRCVVGACTGGSFTTCFVVMTEIAGPSWRVLGGVFIQAWFALGIMILSGIAYFVRDHRTLQLIVAVPAVAFISYWWIMPESPRWLVSVRRRLEAKRIVDKIAKCNNMPSCNLTDLDNQEHFVPKDEILMKEKGPKTATILDLFRTANLRRRTLLVYFNWFVVSLVYYGLSLGTGSLGGSIYLNSFLSGLVEIPGYGIAVFSMNRFGRKKALIVCKLVAGLTCLAASFTMMREDLEALTITLAMAGKCAISGAFAIVYIYSSEVFPTVVRNVGVGSGSMCARIGSLLSPQIARLKMVWPQLPFLIFSLTPLVAAGMIFFLPETLGRRLPETIDDGEQFGENSMSYDVEEDGQDEGVQTPFNTNHEDEARQRQSGNTDQQDHGCQIQSGNANHHDLIVSSPTSNT